MLMIETISRIVAEHPEGIDSRVREFAIKNLLFAFNRQPSIMGVINLSADSWYRESVCLTVDRAVQRGLVLHAQGAALVDVGAESTLAHAARVDASLQKSRLIPVIQGLREHGVLTSVETYHFQVADAALKAGAAVLNLTGTTNLEPMFRLALEHDAAVIICYVQGEHVRAVSDFQFSQDPIELMRDYFARQVEIANRLGLQKVFLDPGLGFYYRNLQDSATRVRHQMKVFLHTYRLRELGCPICHALPHAFEYFGEEVRSAESFFCVLAALGHTDLFRTHEVPRIKAVLDTLSIFHADERIVEKESA